jgi:leucyl aminopeptidase
VDCLIDPPTSAEASQARDLWLVTSTDLPLWLDAQDAPTRTWLEATSFKADRHQLALIPAADGSMRAAVLGLGALPSVEDLDLWHVSGLPERLPAGTRWRIANDDLGRSTMTTVALGWAYGSYRFDSYKSAGAGRPLPTRARLVAPGYADVEEALRLAAATAFARDLINTPACDMTPARLAAEARSMGEPLGARVQEITGNTLRQGFPAIHVVGQAASIEPRLVELGWGDAAHPVVTLIGKGVCFDSGGLDIKPSAGMALMKKDMGGAACVLALARLVMESRLPVRLRVLVPAVENAVSGNAYRPGDVIRTRKGISVEIGNTDAEGRLVLCEALAWADEDPPDLMIDLATLTGAARVALGPELPALYGTRQETIDALVRHGRRVADPLWPMPLWSGYDDDIASKVADINNASSSSFAGSIVAALYLKRFVTRTMDWVHVDLYAWNPRERPGRPVGAEAQAVRAIFGMLAERYG